jgi:hypothetical protein
MITTDKTYIEQFTISYDPHSEAEEAEANKILADNDLDFISRKPVRGNMVLVGRREVLPYDAAIAKLDEWAEELRPQIEAEQDIDKKTRLIKESLTCSGASSFLLNADQA